MTPVEFQKICSFVNGDRHGWEYQPTARIASAGFETNAGAECVEITVWVGHILSDRLADHRPETVKVFSMAGARVALGY